MKPCHPCRVAPHRAPRAPPTTERAFAMHPHLTTPYREQLQAQRASLLDQLAQQRGGPVDRANALGRAPQPEESRAQSATERELAFALDEHETAHLTAVGAALARIAAGTYGECTDCGARITAARLHATPEAARCVHCQEKAEQHRQTT